MWKYVKLLKMSSFTFFHYVSIQSLSLNALIAIFQLWSSASLNLVQYQNGVFINTHILSPDQSKISEADIDRCHPVGPSRFDNQQRQILVKFCSYHTKWKVFRSKSNLKKNKVKVFVCEDLTGANYRLVKSLSDLKKKGHLHSYWTTNGNVLAKLKENSPSIKVKPYDDFLSKLGC